MRVSHRNIYANVLSYMNRSLSGLVELNLQASSQKKINRPSDDPIGMSRVLSYRDSMASMAQYRKNIDTAQGWNGLADENLIQVNVVITRLKELAQQAATGTLSGDNREQISFEARQLYSQLITLSNASYEGKYIYSGHKTDTLAFREALFAQSNGNGTLDGNILSVEGGTSGTVLVQFLDDDDISEQPPFRYSTDGGKTWNNGEYDSTPPIGTQVLVMGGVRVTVNDTATVVATNSADYNDTSGSWLWIRPTAVYQGDDENSIAVEHFGPTATADLDPEATGVFKKNVNVRVDSVAGGNVNYSYSTDGGRSWVEGNTAPANGSPSLPVPGGFLNLDDDPAGGDQFVIRPNRALMHVEISQNETIQINNIGMDVFGGLYNGQPVELRGKLSSNLFETVGKLVGYLETNTQQGAQEALDDLTDVQSHISTYLAGVGARRNRLDITDNILYGLQLNASERKSSIEDVDIAELMTQMHMQQITYEAVLKSSTTIMRMSLVNFM
ncbi:flagellar hook-associated protein FlgL [Desulfonatronum thiodismutans]|uniref:flagellar hook-associated protein FlgL n=1 Tax=Desulfonatronum thiodismutans TaxID=159290 RepID=UPI0004ABECC4|nr:flagellar hook-associated protein FlgL [Desulfonatronum thiodismutans]